MGLSNEERYTKFFNGMRGMRSALVDFKTCVEAQQKEWWGFEKQISLLDSWIEKFDEFVGRTILKLDFSSGYWLVGENEDSYKSLYVDLYGFGAQQGSSIFDELEEPAPDSFNELRDINLVEFLKRIGKHDTEQQDWFALQRFSHWWNVWGWSSFLLYAIRRYDDNLFGDIEKEFVRFLGQYANLRYEVCVGEHTKDVSNLERMLHFKYQVFRLELEKRRDAVRKRFERRCTRASKNRRRGIRVKMFEYFNERSPKELSDLWDYIRGLSMADVREIISKDRKAKEKRHWDYERKQNEKGSKKAKPGLMGPPVPSKKELDRIIDSSENPQELQRALRDLYIYYNTSRFHPLVKSDHYW